MGFGAATSLSNRLASPSEADSVTRIPSLVLDAGWTWAALGVLAGWLASTPRRGAAAGVLVLISATAAYFGVDAMLRDEPLASYRPEILRWSVASALAGPILGLVGVLARRPTAPGHFARLAIPVGATLQLLALPRAAGSGVANPAVTSARLLVLTAAAVAVGAIIARFLLDERRRRVRGRACARRASAER
jgi:hypothetical protein